MYTASVLAALAATIPFTLAAPSPNPAEDVAVKGFSVQQVPGPLVLKSGSVARAAALSKYGAPVPDNVAAAAASQVCLTRPSRAPEHGMLIASNSNPAPSPPRRSSTTSRTCALSRLAAQRRR